MKRLYLVRHAKSSWEPGTLPDAERPLNERGYRDAPRVGGYLAKKYERPDRVVSSPAIRAYSTAFILCQRWQYPPGAILLEPNLYETDAEAYADTVRLQDHAVQSLLLAGHNFSISHFLCFLLGGTVADMPTCAVAVLDLDVPDWSAVQRGCGRLVEQILPKSLPGAGPA
jgi:phosphohistidine phosphatase